MKIQLNRSSDRILTHFIPKEVLAQLITHLDSLPAHIKRMVVLLLLSGIPVNRLCSLTFDSLIRDDYGIWLLRYDNVKTQVKRTIPLSPIAIAMIQQQQQSLNQDQRGVTDLLFHNAKGQAVSPKTFMAQLNRLASKKDIRDATGQVWRFQAHQFRSTFVAKVIKDNVSFDVITHLLGHKQLNTTLRYFHSPQY
jgi:integrase